MTTSSYATRRGTLGHSRFNSLSHRGLILTSFFYFFIYIYSRIGVHELISTLTKKQKKRKSARGESIVNPSPKVLASEEYPIN